MELTNIGVIKELMSRHGVNFSKALGQNFLINPSVSPRIVSEGGVTNQMGVIEIGPGIGVLTKELAKVAKKVVAIELDTTLLPILDETLKDFGNIKIINEDVLKVDLHKLIAKEFPNMEVVVCANLPYYITSPIIMRLLEEKLPIKSITAMVQKEAGERICAPIPSRQMGGITATVAYYASSEILFTVSPGSFMPAPKVESCVLKLNIRDNPPYNAENEADFFRVVKAGFAQRRKTLANTLSAGLQLTKDETRAILEKAEVDPRLRVEQLPFEDYFKIANALTQFNKQ